MGARLARALARRRPQPDRLCRRRHTPRQLRWLPHGRPRLGRVATHASPSRDRHPEPREGPAHQRRPTPRDPGPIRRRPTARQLVVLLHARPRRRLSALVAAARRGHATRQTPEAQPGQYRRVSGWVRQQGLGRCGRQSRGWKSREPLRPGPRKRQRLRSHSLRSGEDELCHRFVPLPHRSRRRKGVQSVSRLARHDPPGGKLWREPD